MTIAFLWILRVIVILIVLRFLLRFIHSISAGAQPSRARTHRTSRTERIGGELVRDPQCGTYVPKDRAIVVGSGRNTQYFCSTECRDKARRAS